MCSPHVRSGRAVGLLPGRAAALRAARRRILVQSMSRPRPACRARGAVKRGVLSGLLQFASEFINAFRAPYRFQPCRPTPPARPLIRPAPVGLLAPGTLEVVVRLPGVRVLARPATEQTAAIMPGSRAPQLRTVATAVMGLNRLNRLCRGSKARLLASALQPSTSAWE
eukprot:jgi/Tetstr1/446123/TSEL_033723.t1